MMVRFNNNTIDQGVIIIINDYKNRMARTRGPYKKYQGGGCAAENKNKKQHVYMRSSSIPFLVSQIDRALDLDLDQLGETTYIYMMHR